MNTVLFTVYNAKTTGRIMSVTQCVAEHMVMLTPTIYKIQQNIDNLTQYLELLTNSNPSRNEENVFDKHIFLIFTLILPPTYLHLICVVRIFL